MKEDIIDFIEVLILKSPPEERPHWVSHFVVPNANELMIKIKTKEGLEGFGLATSYTDIEPIVRPFKNHLAEEIIGMFRLRFFVRRVVKSTLLGRTSE